MSLDLGPTRFRTPEQLAQVTEWLERYAGGPALDLRRPEDVVRHEVAMARAKAPAGPPEPPAARISLPQQQQPRGAPQQSPEQPQPGETLLQRILRMTREGSMCGSATPATTPDPTPQPTPAATPRAPSPPLSSRTVSSTSSGPEMVMDEQQYNESMMLRTKAKARPPDRLALCPKTQPAMRRDPQHGAMAMGSSGDGNGGRDGEDHRRYGGGGDPGEAGAPGDENGEESEEEVEETETQEFMYRMKRRSDELTGRKTSSKSARTLHGSHRSSAKDEAIP